MRTFWILFMLCLPAPLAFASGLSPSPLEKVLADADAVVLAKIVENKVTVVQQSPQMGRASVTYTCKIKATVLAKVMAHAPKKLDLLYTVTVIEGIWHEVSGSGIEETMKPKQKYILLLRKLHGGSFQLLRAEKAARLREIKKLLAKHKKEKDQKKSKTSHKK